MTEASAFFSKLLANPQAECRVLDSYVHKHIPLTQAMQVHAASLSANGLTLCAPLSVNYNHQGSAFGGSLASLAVLAGWGLLWLLLDHGRGVNIVVRDIRMDFLHPVNGALQSTCAWPNTTAWGKFTAMLARRHKARLELRSEILCESSLCARCTAVFAAHRETVGDD